MSQFRIGGVPLFSYSAQLGFPGNGVAWRNTWGRLVFIWFFNNNHYTDRILYIGPDGVNYYNAGQMYSNDFDTGTIYGFVPEGYYAKINGATSGYLFIAY